MSTPADALIAAARAYALATMPGVALVQIRLRFLDGQHAVLPLSPRLELPTVEAEPAVLPFVTATPKAQARHSEDFRSVHWFGTDYSFTAQQSHAVALLWKSWEAGVPDVSGPAILEASGTSGESVRDVFKGSSAWQSLIVAGGSKGSYRLADPQ